MSDNTAVVLLAVAFFAMLVGVAWATAWRDAHTPPPPKKTEQPLWTYERREPK